MIGALTPTRLALVAVTLAAAMSGCGTTCEQIAKDHKEFLARAGEDGPEPHGAISLPFDLVERILREQLPSLDGAQVRIPSLGKLGGVLGGLYVSVEGLKLIPAAPDRVGFRLSLGFAAGDARLFGLAMDAEVEPRLDAAHRAVEVILRPSDLRHVTPHLDPGAAASLARALEQRIPPLLRPAFPRATVAALASKAVEQLGKKTWSLLRESLLVPLGEVGRLRLRIPALPLAGVSIRSEGGEHGRLVLLFRTTLPVEGGLAPGVTPDGGGVGLALSGSTVTELLNHALAAGRVPRRYDAHGKADRAGPFEPGLGFDVGQKPLRLYVWCVREPCIKATLAGTPQVSVRGEKVGVRIDDGRIEDLDGPPLLEVAAFFHALFGRAIRLSVEVAGATELELGRRRYGVHVAGAQLEGATLLVSLSVSPAPL